MHLQIASAAALIGEPTRAALLAVLLDGRAQPATALAHAVRMSPQATSNHLARLVRGGLLGVESEGRHRYYRIASAQVADALESLAGLSGLRGTLRDPPQHVEQRLRFARSCYDHLAGHLGVAIADALQARGHLAAPPSQPKVFSLTDSGRAWCADFGIVLDDRNGCRRPVARRCLDWSERRHHIAGALGAGLLDTLRARRWLVPGQGPRALRLTGAGERGLREALGIERAALT